MSEDTWIPQIGDWAVITTLNSKTYGSLSGIIGHVFCIDYISTDELLEDVYYYASSETNIDGGCWPLDSIRKAEFHEIPIKFRCKPISKEQKNNILKLIKEI